MPFFPRIISIATNMKREELEESFFHYFIPTTLKVEIKERKPMTAQ